jgi:hypothetical protein
MGELAVFDLTVRSVPAHGHRGVFEWTVRIRAVWVEFALLVCLMRFDQGWTWMPAYTFRVLASCSKGARIGHVDRDARWSSWGLMDIFAVFVGTAQVEMTHRRRGVRGVR